MGIRFYEINASEIYKCIVSVQQLTTKATK